MISKQTSLISLTIIIFFSILSISILLNQSKSELLHSFKHIDFWFKTEEQHEEYLKNEVYKHVMLAGIKVYSERDFDGSFVDTSSNNEQIFVSFPRWKNNVPATLAKVVTKETPEGKKITKMEPFPSWEMNKVGVNTSLQSVLGFEIDRNNRMWILDQGKVNNQPAIPGSIKLVIWDLKENKLIQMFHIPEEIASRTNSFLNDLVVDIGSNVCFISDSGIPLDKNKEDYKPGIITFDLDTLEIKRMLDSYPQTKPNHDVWVQMDFDKPCLSTQPMMTGADGISLSCDTHWLYWTPLTSRNLYAIQSSHLVIYDDKSKSINESIIDFGNKISASDGLVCSSQKKLFISGIETNSVYEVDETKLEDYLNQNKKFGKGKDGDGKFFKDLMEPIQQGGKRNRSMIWPDTFSFGPGGYLYWTTNNLCEFSEGSMFQDDSLNFFIWRKKVGGDSYARGCEKVKKIMGVVEWILVAIFIVFYLSGMVAVVIITRIIFLVQGYLKRKALLKEKEPYGDIN